MAKPSNIDAIWAEMNAGSKPVSSTSSSKPNKVSTSSSSASSSSSSKKLSSAARADQILSSLSSSSTPSSSNAASASITKAKKSDLLSQVSSLSISRPTDHPSSSSSDSSLPPSSSSQSNASIESEHVRCEEEGMRRWLAGSRDRASLPTGDSDDEKDDDDKDGDKDEGGNAAVGEGDGDALPPPPERRWTIDRFNSSLNSAPLLPRLTALLALQSVVESLTLRLPAVPELDLPPPYSPDRIVLTHKQGALVSDMAKGEYAPDWDLWQRTHSTLTSQFLKDRSSEGVSTPAPPPRSKLDPVTPGRDPNEEEPPDDGADHPAPSQATSSSSALAVAPLTEMQESRIRQQLQLLLDGTSHSLFKRFGDESERCREAAVRCAILLFLHAYDLTKVVPYLMPALLARYPPTHFDQGQGVFIHDLEAHEAHKRGVAVVRQDRATIVHGLKRLDVVEPSEEVRLLLCDVVGALLKACLSKGSVSVLNPYFSDFVLLLQSQLRDPYPALKCRASIVLLQVLRVPQWEGGAGIFATAVARAAVPNFRHRAAAVRLAALGLFEAAVGVPNRAKVKGAGTEAIADAVGFREENVLPVAAFYDDSCGVSVNALAEVCQDGNNRVRGRACAVLCFFITCLPDRYDHHTRLLPYVMSFYSDVVASTRAMAMEAVEHCGKQYEAEHPDDIIERRQYGVDGDSRTNLKAELPKPFVKRPRLGARLFVRGNCKRFFKALLGELSNWIATTRERSLDLLVLLIVYCEEYLTMDFHQTIVLTVKALATSRNEGKASEGMTSKLLFVHELMGRYVDPDTYVPLLLPRVTGDVGSATTYSEGGVHSDESRGLHAAALAALVKGSLPRRILPHAKALILALCSPECTGNDVTSDVRVDMMTALVSVLEKVKGEDGSGMLLSAHFNETGRLADLDLLWKECCKALLVCQVNENIRLKAIATTGLELLAGSGAAGEGRSGLRVWAPKLQNDAIAKIMDDGWAMWEPDCDEQALLENIWGRNAEPWFGVMETAVPDLIMFGSWVVQGARDGEFETPEVGAKCIASVSSLICAASGFFVAAGAKRREESRLAGKTVETKGGEDDDDDGGLRMLLDEIVLPGGPGEDSAVWNVESGSFFCRVQLLNAALSACGGSGIASGMKGLEDDFEEMGAIIVSSWRKVRNDGERVAVLACALAYLELIAQKKCKGGGKMTSFKKRMGAGAEVVDVVPHEVRKNVNALWTLMREGVSAIDNKSDLSNRKLRVAFGDFAQSFVCFLLPGGGVGDDGARGKENAEGVKAKTNSAERGGGGGGAAKKKETIQLKRVNIELSESDGDDDDDEEMGGDLEALKKKLSINPDKIQDSRVAELLRSADRQADAVASDMAKEKREKAAKVSQRLGEDRIVDELGMTRVEILEDDEDDEDGEESDSDLEDEKRKHESEALGGGGSVEQGAGGPSTLGEFLRILLPLGTTPSLKHGIDCIPEKEAELERYATGLDAALRLAAVLDPKEVLAAISDVEASSGVKCNFLEHLRDHAELIAMLGGQ